jgi:hypothetical protein
VFLYHLEPPEESGTFFPLGYPYNDNIVDKDCLNLGLLSDWQAAPLSVPLLCDQVVRYIVNIIDDYRSGRNFPFLLTVAVLDPIGTFRRPDERLWQRHRNQAWSFLAGTWTRIRHMSARWICRSCAYAAFWPLLINTIYGVRAIDPLDLDVARNFAGCSRASLVILCARCPC